MKKQILSLGKVLSKTEQKLISGGYDPCSVPHITIPGDGCYGGDLDPSGGGDDGPSDPVCLNGWVWSWPRNSCVPI